VYEPDNKMMLQFLPALEEKRKLGKLPSFCFPLVCAASHAIPCVAEAANQDGEGKEGESEEEDDSDEHPEDDSDGEDSDEEDSNGDSSGESDDEGLGLKYKAPFVEPDALVGAQAKEEGEVFNSEEDLLAQFDQRRAEVAEEKVARTGGGFREAKQQAKQ
jgi:hypothetical protein